MRPWPFWRRRGARAGRAGTVAGAGSIFRETGDPSRAEVHYRQALALRPDDAAALSNLADLAADRGEMAEACRSMTAR